MKTAIVAPALAVGMLAGCGGKAEPTVFTAEDGSFSAQFPGEPELDTSSSSIAGVDVEFDFYVYESDDEAYMVNQFDYEPLATEAGMSIDDMAAVLDLDGAVDGAMSSMGGTAESVTALVVEGREARRIEFTGSRSGRDFVGVAQVMVDGVEMYQIMAVGDSGKTEGFNVFVDSFDFLTDAGEDAG